MSGEAYGQFIEVCWEWEAEALPVRGHVDRKMFDAAIGEYGYEPLGPDDVLKHTHWRIVPDATGRWYGKYIFDCRPGPGAFAVTVLDVG